MRILFFLLLVLISNISHADDFSVKIWSALSGTSDPNIYYYYHYLSDKYNKKPIQKSDSFWFNGKQSFHGINSESVFISNGTSAYNFIGIVLEGSPKDVAEKLGNNIGVQFKPVNEKEKYPIYISGSGAEILWEGKNKSKLVYKVKNHKYKFNNNPFN